MKQGKFEASIEQYQKALEKDPNFVASYIGIATDYNFLGEYDQAQAQLQKLFYIARNEGEQRAARFAMTVSYADRVIMTKPWMNCNGSLSWVKRPTMFPICPGT
jgi:tetratricopeptide (TPR) repeat protein